LIEDSTLVLGSERLTGALPDRLAAAAAMTLAAMAII